MTARFTKSDQEIIDTITAQNRQLRMCLAYALITLREVDDVVRSGDEIIAWGGLHDRIKEASTLPMDGEPL